jgi:hypothetical protein
MNLDRIVLDDSSLDVVALAICRTVHGNTHTGLVYRDFDGRLLLFHQAWHHDTRNEPLDAARTDLGGPLLCVRPDIGRDRARNLAALCELISATGEAIAYALRDDPEALFDEHTGRLTLPSGKGLSCSTFVMVLFRSARLPLLDTTDWPADRPGDREFQELQVHVLERSGASPDHVAAVRTEIACARIRPEEVAGAALFSTLPVRFPSAEAGGRVLVERLDAGTP